MTAVRRDLNVLPGALPECGRRLRGLAHLLGDSVLGSDHWLNQAFSYKLLDAAIHRGQTLLNELFF